MGAGISPLFPREPDLAVPVQARQHLDTVIRVGFISRMGVMRDQVHVPLSRPPSEMVVLEDELLGSVRFDYPILDRMTHID